MLSRDLNADLLRRRRATRCYRGAVAFACLLLVVGPGCGSGQSALLPQASVQIIRGKDSAGAIVELEKRGDDLTRARVIDVVLGTGEAEIISDGGGIEFTIDFPAGATVTYVGTVQNASTPSAQEVVGTWTQQAEGIFGEDTGTWSVTADATGK